MAARIFKFVFLSLLLFGTAAAQSAYRVSPGDLIKVIVFGEPDLTLESVRVSGDGRIAFPLIGEVQVVGHTTGELETKFKQLLLDGYLKSPSVTVAVVEYQPLYVRGAVRTPGVFKFKEGMNVAKAITQAGGLTDQADSQDIKLLRASKELPQTNMETAVLPGDVLVVGGGNEPGLFFYVYGAVARPGSFPYRDDLSVEKAVILAGGFSARASRRKVKIKHEDGVELDRVALETPVRPGDIITVGESLF